MKNIMLLMLLSVFLQCGKGSGKPAAAPAEGLNPVLSPTPQPTSPSAPQKPQFVFGGFFVVKNSGAYETLLKSCSRCGTKRVSPGGGYQRIWVLGDSPVKCKHWLSEGYIQVVFQEQKLPTKAVVTLQPKYSASACRSQSKRCYGHSFSAKGIADAIKENKGFSIILSPAGGLGGVTNLYIRSETTNHITHTHLKAHAIYGSEASSVRSGTMLSVPLVKQTELPLRKPRWQCGQWPPNLFPAPNPFPAFF